MKVEMQSKSEVAPPREETLLQDKFKKFAEDNVKGNIL